MRSFLQHVKFIVSFLRGQLTNHDMQRTLLKSGRIQIAPCLLRLLNRSQSPSKQGSHPLQRGTKTSKIALPPKGQTLFRIGSFTAIAA